MDQILELGIVVHSIVIGLSVGVTNKDIFVAFFILVIIFLFTIIRNTCTIKGLIAALFASTKCSKAWVSVVASSRRNMVGLKSGDSFFFAVTTLFEIVLGMALSKTYKENSPDSLFTVGLLTASSARLLIYMALVDLLAADFMGQKMQRSIKLQMKSYVVVLLGSGGMAVMAKWA